VMGHGEGGAVATWVNREFMRHAETCMVPVTDLPPLFERLRQKGTRIGVATNDSEEALRAQIRRLGIDRLIDFFCGYDSGHGAKPGPGRGTALARAVDLPVEAIALVGDSLPHLDMAPAAGARPTNRV